MCVRITTTSYGCVAPPKVHENNARLQELGLPTLSSMFANKAIISPEKEKAKHNRDESEDEYHPNEDDTSEGDSSDDNLVDEREALQELKSIPSHSSKSKVLKSSI